jgi:hypothetical protein
MEAFYSIREENELLGIDLVSDFAFKHLADCFAVFAAKI